MRGSTRDSAPDGPQGFAVGALQAIRWISAVGFLVIGLGFIVLFAAPVIGISNLKPILMIREILGPISDAIIRASPISHPFLEKTVPLLLGIGAFLLRQLVDNLLLPLVGRDEKKDPATPTQKDEEA